MEKREWSPCWEIKPSFYFFWEMRKTRFLVIMVKHSNKRDYIKEETTDNNRSLFN